MSNVPEQLREVGAEMGRVVQCHQQEEQRGSFHHEETRKVIKDTGDTLHALLTGLQEAVTHLREGQDQGASLQKEAMKKHDDQMDELIKETKKELRRQARRLKVAATGRTASVERSLEELQEGVVKMRATLEEVRGLVAPMSEREGDSGGCSAPLAASSLRQVVDSTRTGLDEVLASVRGVDQLLSGLSSHLSTDISQAVREALQHHFIVQRANSTGGASCSSHLNASISISPNQRTFSAHRLRPVLPLNESFSLCQTSPVAHVSPITQASPITHTTATITTTATHQPITTTRDSLHHHHHHRHHAAEEMPTSGSMQHLQPAPPPPHSTARNHSKPQPVSVKVGQPQRVDSNKAPPPQRPQQMNPQHPTSRPSQSQQLNTTALRPQQSSARHSHTQHFNQRVSHPQHLSSRPSIPQQTQPRLPRPQQIQARPPQPAQRHPQLKPKSQLPQQGIIRTPKPQQGNTDTHSSQRITVRVANVQKAGPSKTGPSQQTQQPRSVNNEAYSTSQPSQHPQPSSQPLRGVCKQCPPSQQNSKPVSTQHYPNLRPRPRPQQYTIAKPRQTQQTRTRRPQSPLPQQNSVKKAPQQHKHLQPKDNNLRKVPQHHHNHPPPPSPPPQHQNIQKTPHHQHNHLPQQYNNLKKIPEHQYSTTPLTQHSQHHQHNPTRVEPQHSKVRVTTVRQTSPPQQRTSNYHTRSTQQCITNSPFTQQDLSTPHHSTLMTSTPKVTSQPQPQTIAWNQYPSLSHSTPGQWSQQGDEFTAEDILVDHEEIVTTSFDEGRPDTEEAEVEEAEEAESNNTSNEVCRQCNPAKPSGSGGGVERQGGGEGTEGGVAGGGQDCFSSASCEWEWTSTQRFTPQNASGGDGKHVLDYDTTSSEDSPIMTPRNTLASLHSSLPSPPPPAAPFSAPVKQRQTTRTALQTITGAAHTIPRHGPVASEPRTVAVAAVAPSAPLPGPEVTPRGYTTPWRVVVSSALRGLKAAATNTGTQTTRAVFKDSFTSAPTTGMKRRYLEEREGKEQQEGSCVRTKRFLMSFSTPAPRLVLTSSSKGRLRANLADIV
ncbi:protein piccolo-like isoform X2 [Portunus trituberculatus]|uniref:protein piccolo-like isoform X2 n=1 Tax=Portunus trituberculatus TaxID=210409 RepID=UPI001E1CB6CC|nr:protein piccolo-like isoform X2 [Portunus trituberculatus]